MKPALQGGKWSLFTLDPLMMQVWEHLNEPQSQCETKFAQFGSQTAEIQEDAT